MRISDWSSDVCSSDLLAERPREPAIARYLSAVEACRKAHGHDAYPGSPWLLAHALRDHDRIACCELQPVEAAALRANFAGDRRIRSEEHTSELQSLMRISYAVFCLKKKQYHQK